jgi:hypothetical protein
MNRWMQHAETIMVVTASLIMLGAYLFWRLVN